MPLPSPIYTHPCVKLLAGGKLLYNTGNSAGCSVMTWRSGIGVAGGRLQQEGICVNTERIHIVVQQKPTQHCKAVELQLKFF